MQKRIYMLVELALHSIIGLCAFHVGLFPPFFLVPIFSCRRVCRTLGLSIPSANLRSLVIRHATQLATEFYRPGDSGSQLSEAEEGLPVGLREQENIQRAHGSATLSASSAAMIPSLSRRHPLVVPAVQLAEIVLRLKIAEGRTLSTQAAAVLQIAADAVPPPSVGPAVIGRQCRQGRPSKPPIQATIRSLFGADKGCLAACKKIIIQKLLGLARMLPFGTSVTAHDVIQYLPT